MPDTDDNNDKRKSVFEGMEFHETELRTPNDKPPFRFVPEATSLDESKKVEFALRDDVQAFLAGKKNPKLRTPSYDLCHEVKACSFADGSLEDLMQWTMSTMDVLQKKPCETADSTLNTVEALLCGEAIVNWKEKERECVNTIVRDKDDDGETHIVGRTHQSFESTFKSFFKILLPSLRRSKTS